MLFAFSQPVTKSMPPAVAAAREETRREEGGDAPKDGERRAYEIYELVVLYMFVIVSKSPFFFK